jgi:hypothetical protein
MGRADAYDAYARLGYHYLAASADGGGWYPTTGDYGGDVEKMVAPLRQALENDPDALNGGIIFQKDGYNMSMQSPVADALDRQLALLSSYGYRVTGAEALMKISPFEDVPAGDECLEAVRGMESAGYCLGFRNNTFKPDEPVTAEQLTAMCTKRSEYTARRRTERAVLSADGIRRIISQQTGDCGTVGGTTRRDAAIVLWESGCLTNREKGNKV